MKKDQLDFALPRGRLAGAAPTGGCLPQGLAGALRSVDRVPLK